MLYMIFLKSYMTFLGRHFYSKVIGFIHLKVRIKGHISKEMIRSVLITVTYRDGFNLATDVQITEHLSLDFLEDILLGDIVFISTTLP